ncbi:hypothetical protein M5689_000691 [Euphorbia peplus]|nr:hypothetical protein M5689_000691 [Euphorbia peplus]
MNQHEKESYFGGKGFIGIDPNISGVATPSVEDLRRMSQCGSDDVFGRFASMGQRYYAPDMVAQVVVMQELQQLKSQNLQLMSMLRMQDPSVYIRNLCTPHLAAYDELYKLRQLALTLPTLENIALASTKNVNNSIEILTEEVKEANETFDSQGKVIPAKLDDLQSTANHILREVKSSAQGSSSSGVARIVYDITLDLNNKLESIESSIKA